MRSLALALLLLASCSKDDENEAWVDPAEVPEVEAVAAVAGTPFKLSAQHGKVVLLAFGYGGCTEVCPITLSRLAALHGLLGDRAAQVVLLYVSVDPERDDAARLKEKVLAHGEGIEAIAPPEEQLTPLLNALSAQARKRLPDAKGSYGMSHSVDLYALDRSGRLRVRFGPEATTAQIDRGLNKLLEEAK